MTTFHARPMVLAAASLLIFSAGCKKAPEPVATPAPAPVVAPASAPAPVAMMAAAPVSATNADGVTTTATVGDGKSVDWAMEQDKIKHDPLGQWASDATASSNYNDNKDHDRYTPWQATGAPNVDTESDNPAAWTAKTASAGIEWLDLTFPNAVQSTGVRIRESDNAGTIIKVELFDDHGTPHTLWTGTDPTKGLNYFELSYPKTAYKANRVKVTLATNLLGGWKEIDAVQLLGSN